jgi:hypothetical protein
MPTATISMTRQTKVAPILNSGVKEASAVSVTKVVEYTHPSSQTAPQVSCSLGPLPGKHSVWNTSPPTKLTSRLVAGYGFNGGIRKISNIANIGRKRKGNCFVFVLTDCNRPFQSESIEGNFSFLWIEGGTIGLTLSNP